MDITVKGKHPFGKYFAPTWSMVMAYKKSKNAMIYRDQYRDILEANNYQVRRLVEYSKKIDIVLVCYCRPENFCHRFVLANYLEKTFNVKYMGEI